MFNNYNLLRIMQGIIVNIGLYFSLSTLNFKFKSPSITSFFISIEILRPQINKSIISDPAATNKPLSQLPSNRRTVPPQTLRLVSQYNTQERCLIKLNLPTFFLSIRPTKGNNSWDMFEFCKIINLPNVDKRRRRRERKHASKFINK